MSTELKSLMAIVFAYIKAEYRKNAGSGGTEFYEPPKVAAAVGHPLADVQRALQALREKGTLESRMANGWFELTAQGKSECWE